METVIFSTDNKKKENHKDINTSEFSKLEIGNLPISNADSQPSKPIPIGSHSSASNMPMNQSSSQDFVHEFDNLSSSFYDTDSLPSVSQSLCSDDFEFKKKRKKRKKKDNQKNMHSDATARPNYFVGIQISNPEIHKRILDVQKVLLSADEKVWPALIDVATLHITLLVAHIANEDELHTACSALDHCGANLSAILSHPPLCLSFKGISHFSNQTIFAKVVEDENYRRLLSIAEVVRSKFEEMEVIMPDKRAFTPHLTIAKVSKVPRGKGKDGIKKIDPNSYVAELNKEFGQQEITGLQLLSMNKPKNKSRYYPIVRETLFDFIPKESSDHSLCCFPRQPLTPKLQRRLHTSSTPSDTLLLPSVTSSTPSDTLLLPSVTSSTPSDTLLLPSGSNSLRSYRPLALTVIGGIGLLSFAFAISRWMKKK